MSRPRFVLLSAAAFALATAGCAEIAQDAPKPYAGKADTQPYASDVFKGDKAKYEAAMAKRAGFQDEYPRIRASEAATATAASTSATTVAVK